VELCIETVVSRPVRAVLLTSFVPGGAFLGTFMSESSQGQHVVGASGNAFSLQDEPGSGASPTQKSLQNALWSIIAGGSGSNPSGRPPFEA